MKEANNIFVLDPVSADNITALTITLSAGCTNSVSAHIVRIQFV